MAFRDAIQPTLNRTPANGHTHKIKMCQSEVLVPTDPRGGLLLEALCLSVSKTLTATNHPSVNTIIQLNTPQRSGRRDDEEILDT
ncbi:hypothetical protein Ctob_007493, partial [Chrysochromulina tobinii]